MGLGYYIRLLSMIVRENMSVEGTWKITKEGKALEGYFTEAYALVNCMRDEWKNKGKLYGYLINPELGLWAQEVPFDRESLMSSLRGPTPAPATNIAFGNPYVMDARETIVKFEENGAPPLPSSEAVLQIGRVQTGSDSLQISNLAHEPMDNSLRSPIGDGTQSKGMTGSKDNTASPFLESLGDELHRKRLEALRNQLTLRPKVHEAAIAPNGKRIAPVKEEEEEEEEHDIKRRRFDYPSSHRDQGFALTSFGETMEKLRQQQHADRKAA